ncbi:conserved hypothetical protein [Burkholderiales bacterium]|nr:conserved hypothetical protein [Burkholderiales bacterium]
MRSSAAQFDPAMARELVEFAVDLDAQDDRNGERRARRRESTLSASRASSSPAADSIYLPQYGDRWQMLVDTRKQYSDGTGRSSASEPSWNPDDPDCNGFGPFANAWILANGNPAAAPDVYASPPTYVVAIRGTVFSDRPSVVEDVFADTIAAHHLVRPWRGMALPLVFAQLPGAEIHAGFGYACLSLLFDRRFGLVRALQAIAQQEARIVLTGHSQGAAMATLIHAFLHYASRSGPTLGAKRLHLTSYVFAQPKPGNALFAADFDRLLLHGGDSFTINNSLDPVPEVPLTRQSLGDLRGDFPAGSRIDRLVNAFGRPARLLRHVLFSQMDRQIVELMRSEDLVLDPGGAVSCRARACKFAAGSSLNYSPAGTPVPLIGDADAAYPGQDPRDAFVQHHSPTYRELLARR